MAYSYNVTVYRQRLQSEFQVGGQGYRWMDKVRREMHTRAEAYAAGFTRSGEILAGHRSYQRGINQWACEFTVLNVADHAEWKHEGTVGPIKPKRAKRIVIPAGNGYGKFVGKKVRGQEGEPWLERACDSVAYGYGAVPY